MHRIRARAPRGELQAPPTLATRDAVTVFLQDAACTPGGHAPLVALPRSEAEVAWLLRGSRAVLPVGAQSSLTGGATPFGASVLSLARLDRILELGAGQVELEAGVALSTLADELHGRGLF